MIYSLMRVMSRNFNRYFDERVRKFISKMVMDKRSPLSVKYYTYKVEFQQVIWYFLISPLHITRIFPTEGSPSHTWRSLAGSK